MNQRTHLFITPLPPFNFDFTAYSHGWVVLAPNAWDGARHAVQRVERLSTGNIVQLDITGAGNVEQPQIAVQVKHTLPLTHVEQHEITAAVGRMFRVDEDLSEFYVQCRARGGRWEKLTGGLGHLLRSPTVFEDVVKTICTTNIQWGGTKRMVEGLVSTYGDPCPGDSAARAFPTPQAIAATPRETFVETVRMGYRAPYVHALAQGVASGEVDLEALLNADLPTPDLRKRLLAIKGVGPYAAATLLMLLGRYDELAVDTVFRLFVSKRYFGGQRPSDTEARAVYDDWGRWKYLAYWFDIWEGLDEVL